MTIKPQKQRAAPGISGTEFNVVTYQDDRDAAAVQLFQYLRENLFEFGVKAFCRLIQQEYFRFEEQYLGQCRPLLLAADRSYGGVPSGHQDGNARNAVYFFLHHILRQLLSFSISSRSSRTVFLTKTPGILRHTPSRR